MMRHRLFLTLGLLLGLAVSAVAEDHLCVKTDRIPQVRYVRSVDPTKLVAQPGETCTTLSKATTAAQWERWQTGTKKHLKVVGGILVEMDEAEKQAVETALAAPRLAVQPFHEELAQAGCAKALGAITQEIDAFYDPRVAAIQAKIDRVTDGESLRAALGELNEHYSQERVITAKLARCLAALIKVLGK